MELLICRYAFYPVQKNSTGVNIVSSVLQMYASLHIYHIPSSYSSYGYKLNGMAVFVPLELINFQILLIWINIVIFLLQAFGYLSLVLSTSLFNSSNSPSKEPLARVESAKSREIVMGVSSGSAILQFCA
jgi:sensor histidine kinase YesM